MFAVPLLVYGMAIGPREAVGVSLASVGGTALFGVTPRLFRGEVELRTGILFAVAGMIGAPLGNYLSGFISEDALLGLFGLLMFVVAFSAVGNFGILVRQRTQLYPLLLILLIASRRSKRRDRSRRATPSTELDEAVRL